MEKGLWIMTGLVDANEKKTKFCTLTCSQCGKVIYHVRYPFKYHYCPNCGAKMDIIKK